MNVYLLFLLCFLRAKIIKANRFPITPRLITNIPTSIRRVFLYSSPDAVPFIAAPVLFNVVAVVVVINVVAVVFSSCCSAAAAEAAVAALVSMLPNGFSQVKISWLTTIEEGTERSTHTERGIHRVWHTQRGGAQRKQVACVSLA